MTTVDELMRLAQTWADLRGVPGYDEDARDSLRDAIEWALCEAHGERLLGKMRADPIADQPQPEAVDQARDELNAALAWPRGISSPAPSWAELLVMVARLARAGKEQK